MHSLSPLRPMFLRIIAVLLLLAPAALSAEERGADDVFKKWLTWQRRFEDVDLSRQVVPDRSFALRAVAGLPDELTPQLGFLGVPTDTRQMQSADAEKVARTMGQIYRELESDMGAFVERLRESGFATVEINRREEIGERDNVTEIYRNFFESLYDLDGSREEERALLALANRMYEFAFGAATFAKFRPCLEKPELRPIARLFYANMWYNLSGTGWRFWHEQALKNLREEIGADGEVVYIAGGTDIYHLLRSGIYRIRNIDPIFPSQVKYYSEGWEFLIKGAGPRNGVGDRISFGEFYMERSAYSESGSFRTPPLSNNAEITIPQSVTTWKIFEADGTEIGYYILERRFATQADFRPKANQTLLISFNELAYIADPGPRGWGIDVDQFPDNLRIHVKQLRRPVSKAMMQNMRAAEQSTFSYIRLGTSIN